ncbi:hypothetical protein E2C01_011796 [Portunus trituberculatus]|uniref:Uncharacterized protein n=1 Tax=Portunus trituberculatus TaxID=210409 RepID=A0A5B7DC20_PORTR|nr:hypothetical protein [Portunus trituberculatus]
MKEAIKYRGGKQVVGYTSQDSAWRQNPTLFLKATSTTLTLHRHLSSLLARVSSGNSHVYHWYRVSESACSPSPAQPSPLSPRNEMKRRLVAADSTNVLS